METVSSKVERLYNQEKTSQEDVKENWWKANFTHFYKTLELRKLKGKNQLRYDIEYVIGSCYSIIIRLCPQMEESREERPLHSVTLAELIPLGW